MLRELLLLLYGESQGVSRVHPLEYRLSVIDVVAALTDVEVDDTDGVHLSHLGILVALVDVLSDGLGRPVEHPLEIVNLGVVLYLDNNQLTFGILGEHVHPVELVVGGLLVALAFEHALDYDLLS